MVTSMLAPAVRHVTQVFVQRGPRCLSTPYSHLPGNIAWSRVLRLMSPERLFEVTLILA